ncbi:MAG: hypothetical protein R2784_10550 [Saprospiraceae bacterium]
MKVAADANNDELITTFDAFNILQLALGNIASVPGNTSGDLYLQALHCLQIHSQCHSMSLLELIR